MLLPTGKILAIGGSANDEDGSTASLTADLYDPKTNSFSSAAPNVYPHLYHSTALLLPDATVVLSGGNPQQRVFEPHIEIYQPAYLFNPDGSLATRPSLTAVPATLGYGQTSRLHPTEQSPAPCLSAKAPRPMRLICRNAWSDSPSPRADKPSR